MTWRKNRRFYAGRTLSWCECHGFTKGWAVKVHGVLGVTYRRHYPWVWMQFGSAAKIEYASANQWQMMNERTGDGV